MVRTTILSYLQILSRGSPMQWYWSPFSICPSKVNDLLAISLCPFHGVGANGVHKNTYGRLVRRIIPTRWDKEKQAWFFEAESHSGNPVPGVIWYRKVGRYHLASIEVQGSKPHISSVFIDPHSGKGFYLVGWPLRVATQFLDYLVWSTLAPMVFAEDLQYVELQGYAFPVDSHQVSNPFQFLFS